MDAAAHLAKVDGLGRKPLDGHPLLLLVLLLNVSGNAKVAQLDVIDGMHEHVPRSQVAVHKALRTNVRHRTGNLQAVERTCPRRVQRQARVWTATREIELHALCIEDDLAVGA